MLLLLGELARARAVDARASSSSPSSTSASTSSGATGNAPGSLTPSRSVCSQTARRRSAAAAGLVGEQRRDPERPLRLEQVPADAGLPARARSPPPPSVAPRRAPRPAASSARQRSYIGQRSSSLSDDSAHSSSSRSAASHSPARSSSSHRCSRCSAYEDGSPRSSAIASSAVRSARASADLAPPDEPLPGDPLRRRRRCRDALAATLAEALADVVDRRGRGGCAPRRARTARAALERRLGARAASGERLERPRLGLARSARRGRRRRSRPSPRARPPAARGSSLLSASARSR